MLNKIISIAFSIKQRRERRRTSNEQPSITQGGDRNPRRQFQRVHISWQRTPGATTLRFLGHQGEATGPDQPAEHHAATMGGTLGEFAA